MLYRDPTISRTGYSAANTYCISTTSNSTASISTASIAKQTILAIWIHFSFLSASLEHVCPERAERTPQLRTAIGISGI